VRTGGNQETATAVAEGSPKMLADRPSIAVPFVSLSDDQEQEYLVDGITNDIITDLSKFSSLFVIAANSTFRYKGQAFKVQDVARDLGVRYVLEGSVQQSGAMLRANAQLIDASTGRHVWAERYDRPTEDIFVVQKEITRSVAGVIGSERGALLKAEIDRIARTATENLNAYEFFLRGVVHDERETEEDNRLARQMFERALEHDPRYAKAMAELSLTYLQDIWGQWTSERESSLALAEEWAGRAIEVEPSEPLGYMALAFTYQLRAKVDQALPLIEKAHELNPNDWHVKFALGYAAAYAGRPSGASS
jgi:adenylate cyclase